MSVPEATPLSERELVLTRLIDAAPERLFQAWTDPKLLPQWFAPRPLTTPVCEIDLRVGGVCRTVMRTPDGVEYPNEGVYLEIVENRRVVFTDAFGADWAPSGKPFMVATISFEPEGGQTRYTARAQHWTVADREAHEQMGFHEGWGQCADQLAELLAQR
ncbi:MAG: hypothetical protein JWP92_1151 [Caulobacter sp.]|nr:hypothetical protein [Caulobacter sp.]